MPTLGEKIKQLRKKNKLTQKQFGNFVGISDAHVSNIESGKDNPSKPLIQLICTRFSVNENWLCEDSENSYPMKFHYIDSLKNGFKELIEDNNLTERTAMKKIGLSSYDYHELESGNPNIDLHSLIKVCDYFDVSLDWLVRGKESTVYRSADLSKEELNSLIEYRQLDEDEKSILRSLLGKLTSKK